MKFSGVYAALSTPFNNGAIDEAAFSAIVKKQILRGSDGIAIASTTGEGSFLSVDEKITLAKTTAKVKNSLFSVGAAGRFKTIVGISAIGTNEAVEQIKRLSAMNRELEIDAFLVLSPFYSKATDDGALKHFYSVADASDVPVIVYNVPSRTGYDVPAEVIAKLAEHKNVVGVKEASLDVLKFAKIAYLTQNATDFDLLCGADELFLPELALGANGIISVLANVAPKHVKAVYERFVSGDTVAAKSLHLEALPLIRELFGEVNPVPLKAALGFTDGIKEEFRLPLTPLATNKKRELVKVLAEFLKLEFSPKRRR